MKVLSDSNLSEKILKAAVKWAQRSRIILARNSQFKWTQGSIEEQPGEKLAKFLILRCPKRARQEETTAITIIWTLNATRERERERKEFLLDVISSGNNFHFDPSHQGCETGTRRGRREMKGATGRKFFWRRGLRPR